MASSATLHTPFAQAHTAGSSSSSSRTSPFQQASAAAGLAEADDPESAWVANTYGPRLRQRYLDVFEPMGPAPARSSSAGRAASSSRVQDYDVHQPRNFGSRAGTPAQLRIVLAEDSVPGLNSSSGSTQQHQPHIIRAHAILTTSNSAHMHSPSTHRVSAPGLQASNSMDSAAARRPSSSGSSSASNGNSNSGASLRRLQRRSSSLLAATSATASNLWSAFSDRSRALLCRNSSVVDGIGQHGSSDSTQSRGSSEPGSSIRVLPLGPGVAAPAAVVGSPVGSGIVRVPGRLSQRLLLRSTAIRRSAGARSPAVLIDVDATDSYDDLLALDQFNVKRAVRASVLKGLPCRTPSLQDAQQQRQCHICFESWLPPEGCDAADDTAAAADGSSAGCSRVKGGEQGCCQCCALYPQQQRQQHVPQLPPLLDGQRQRVLDRMQLLCWDGPVGLHGAIVPAPAPARLMGGFDDVLASADSDVGPRGPAGDAASSSSSSGDGGSRERSVVQGWTGMAAGEAGASADTGQQLLRQAGHNRVEAAAAGRALASPDVSAAAGVPSATHSSVPVSSGAGTSHGSSSAAGSSALGGQRCSCRRVDDSGGAAGRRKVATAGVQIQLLPCGHEFCSGCIQTWLKEHTSCPVCRWTFPECDTRLINK